MTSNACRWRRRRRHVRSGHPLLWCGNIKIKMHLKWPICHVVRRVSFYDGWHDVACIALLGTFRRLLRDGFGEYASDIVLLGIHRCKACSSWLPIPVPSNSPFVCQFDANYAWLILIYMNIFTACFTTYTHNFILSCSIHISKHQTTHPTTFQLLLPTR